MRKKLSKGRIKFHLEIDIHTKAYFNKPACDWFDAALGWPVVFEGGARGEMSLDLFQSNNLADDSAVKENLQRWSGGSQVCGQGHLEYRSKIDVDLGSRLISKGHICQ